MLNLQYKISKYWHWLNIDLAHSGLGKVLTGLVFDIQIEGWGCGVQEGETMEKNGAADRKLSPRECVQASLAIRTQGIVCFRAKHSLGPGGLRESMEDHEVRKGGWLPGTTHTHQVSQHRDD